MKYLWLVLVIGLAATGNLCGQPIADKKFTKSIKVATDSINQLMKRRDIPGLVVTVSLDGKLVWSQGFGYSDLEQQVPADPSRSRFRIGSISKSLTIATLGRLYERNMIIPDSSIYFYLPDYPLKKFRPTVRQVSGHIGGIRAYKGQEFYITEHYNSVDVALSVFKEDPLESKPGTTYLYSSHGFNLLSAVLEHAGRKKFLDLVRDEVFGPLNMIQTSADVNDSIIAGRTRYYEVGPRGLVNAPYVDNSYKWAGGGFISTSEDITKFAQALLRADYLRTQTIQMLTTQQTLADGKTTSYGMGFGVGKDDQGNSFFGHTGGSVGGTSDMVIFPQQRMTIVVLTNLSGARLGGIAKHVGQLFMVP